MRILKLTSAAERQLLRTRHTRDAEAERIAAGIVNDVRRRGDKALFAWSRKLDGLDLRREPLWVAESDYRSAQRAVATDFLKAVVHAARNIRKVSQRQLPPAWMLCVEPGVTVRQTVRPIESIGCYIPGGRNALVSTLLMTVIPAQVAGVPKITIVCARPNSEMLAAAHLLGVRQIARIGGAQAIAALAYGTRSVPRVEKIFGPGNRFVTAAKQLVSSDCAIDLAAGPTEAVILANEGNPAWIAADLLAQAEHAPDAACFLVTTSATFARAVRGEALNQLRKLPRVNPAHSSTRNTGAILLARSVKAACEFVNRFAPEHLSLPTPTNSLRSRLHSFGTIFVGSWAAQPLGDYASGSNHVLPTSGWARRRGGLSTADFVKCSTEQMIDERGFRRLAPQVMALAQAEGLVAHANAVEIPR
jgi:histidinol dehydrogenase